MADQDIKNRVRNLKCPVFDKPAFTTPPSLEAATVALVTSASLHHPDQDEFAPMDATYRVLDGARRDYVVGHWSPNFDTAGVAVDLNVVFPIDRATRRKQTMSSGQLNRQ